MQLDPRKLSKCGNLSITILREKSQRSNNAIKKNNPQTNVPPVTIDDKKRYNLADETEKGSSYWSHFYFYNKEDNEIMLAWTRPSGENKTTFAFVGVNKGLTLGNWKDINSDFTRKENLEKKEKFESLILNNIKRYLK